jgi:hypothetical protein
MDMATTLGLTNVLLALLNLLLLVSTIILSYRTFRIQLASELRASLDQLGDLNAGRSGNAFVRPLLNRVRYRPWRREKQAEVSLKYFAAAKSDVRSSPEPFDVAFDIEELEKSEFDDVSHVRSHGSNLSGESSEYTIIFDSIDPTICRHETGIIMDQIRQWYNSEYLKRNMERARRRS